MIPALCFLIGVAVVLAALDWARRAIQRAALEPPKVK